MIKNFTEDDIITTSHAFFRLCEEEREIAQDKRIKGYIFGQLPFLVGIQYNGNYAAFYKYDGRVLNIILEITPNIYKSGHILYYKAQSSSENMKNKCFNGKGIVDYDYKNDILFFKKANSHYLESIEFENFVLDIDKEKFISGIQIFEASKFLNLGKRALLKMPKWEFSAVVKDNTIQLRLAFSIKIRNKIIGKNPIIVRHLSHRLPDSELVCAI